MIELYHVLRLEANNYLGVMVTFSWKEINEISDETFQFRFLDNFVFGFWMVLFVLFQ